RVTVRGYAGHGTAVLAGGPVAGHHRGSDEATPAGHAARHALRDLLDRRFQAERPRGPRAVGRALRAPARLDAGIRFPRPARARRPRGTARIRDPALAQRRSIYQLDRHATTSG